MKLKELMVAHAFDVRESTNKVYHDEKGSETDEKIIYLLFDKAITYEGLTEDFAVMSRRVSTKFKSCASDEERIAFLESCEFSRNDQDGISQFAITMGNNRLFRFNPPLDNDKNKLKDSLFNLKKKSDVYPYDYIVIDVNKWEAHGEKFAYDHNYNQYGDETDTWLIEVEDNKPKYIFDNYITNIIDEFVEIIDTLITLRDRANSVYRKLNTYAQYLVEEYEYNNRHYSQIVWNIKEGKVQKRIFNSEYDYDENQPSEGVFVMDVDEFIEEKCGYDNEGYEYLEGYYLNEKKVRRFVFETIVEFNNLPEEYGGLWYPEDFLN